MDAFASPSERSAWHVATIGYAMDGSSESDLNGAFADGLAWLGQRAWFRPNQARTLEADGVSAFGIALGAANASASDAHWLRSLVTQSARLPSLPELDRSLMVAAAHVTNAPGRLDHSTMLPEVRVALAHLGLWGVDDSCREATWQRIVNFTDNEGLVHEAALLLKSLVVLTEHNLPARLGRLEPVDVVNVLQGVQRSLRRWTWDLAPKTRNSAAARWEVENEYHVQNLLWSLLAPLFRDLDDERYLPPVGQKSPRADLAIPSLGTIVEVKFMRRDARFQDVIEEIAADASLYGTDARWTSLIPFVWDDARRLEEHQKLIDGLRQLPLVIDAVVVARPGKMDRPVPPSSSRIGRSSTTRLASTKV